MRTAMLATSRIHLDGRLKSLGRLRAFDSPSKGWLRAIRNALGITAEQLATRMGIKQPTLSGIERSEADGTISLNTLEKAAQAMGCRLVYALVPEHGLEATVRSRALEVARRRLARVNHTMGLEDQAVESRVLKRKIGELADYLVEHELSRIWNED